MNETPQPPQVAAVDPTLDYQMVPRPDPSDQPHEPGKPWRVGTLAYTTGGLVVLFAWLLWGDFAWAMKDRTVSDVVTLLIHKFHASDTLTMLLMVIVPQVIIIIVQPIVSYKSDRHRGRWGRRIPFLLAPTPFAVLSMVGLAFAPFLGGWLSRSAFGHSSIGRSFGLDGSTLTFYALFWITFEVATTVADSVYRAFVNDVVPRPVLGRFYGMFRALSLIAGMIFNEYFFGLSGTHYVAIFIGVGLLYGIGFSVMCLKVKEGRYPPPPPLPQRRGKPVDAKASGPNSAVSDYAELEKDLTASRFAAIQSYFRDCFTHPYYFMVFAAIILPNLAFIPINTFNLYFAQSLGMSNSDFGHYKAIYFGISLIQTVPLGWLVDKYHPLRVSIIALILHGAASLWGGIFIHGTTSFAIAYIATGTLSGTWFTATASMSLVLMPKVKFAQYYSAMAAIQSLLVICFSVGAGRVLDLTHHLYRLTYLAGGTFDILGLISTVIVYLMFLKLGGTRNYVAP
jgi:MFS family permease